MTGNRHGDVVRRDRVRDRAHRLRRADSPRDVGVANGFADRNLLERPPDTLLESRAADVEWQVQADRRLLDEPDDLSHQRLITAIGADETCPRKTVLQAPDQLVSVIAEQNGGDALLARRDQDRAERRLPDRELDLLVDAACAVL